MPSPREPRAAVPASAPARWVWKRDIYHEKWGCRRRSENMRISSWKIRISHDFIMKNVRLDWFPTSAKMSWSAHWHSHVRIPPTRRFGLVKLRGMEFSLWTSEDGGITLVWDVTSQNYRRFSLAKPVGLAGVSLCGLTRPSTLGRGGASQSWKELRSPENVVFEENPLMIIPTGFSSPVWWHQRVVLCLVLFGHPNHGKIAKPDSCAPSLHRN